MILKFYPQTVIAGLTAEELSHIHPRFPGLRPAYIHVSKTWQEGLVIRAASAAEYEKRYRGSGHYKLTSARVYGAIAGFTPAWSMFGRLSPIDCPYHTGGVLPHAEAVSGDGVRYLLYPPISKIRQTTARQTFDLDPHEDEDDHIADDVVEGSWQELEEAKPLPSAFKQQQRRPEPAAVGREAVAAGRKATQQSVSSDLAKSAAEIKNYVEELNEILEEHDDLTISFDETTRQIHLDQHLVIDEDF
jgi:hypothetical protein